MNYKQENQLSMAKAVLEALRLNETSVNTVPAFAAAKTELQNVVNELDTLIQHQSVDITGYARDKLRRPVLP